jgi:3-oxoacyl-[acyl-carrier protein] reductase
MTTARTDEHPGIGLGLGRLRGRVAVVTGADSGIGRATARLFAREGAKVVCVDIQESGNPRVDKLVHQDGGEALFVQGDVTSAADWGRVIRSTLDRYGDLDILFNNAGAGVRKRLDEFTDEEWNFVINVNLNSIYHGVRAALPHFLRKGRGNIVSTSSSFGILAMERYPAYCATKAAIVNLTRQLAIDYGPGIRVNCVCPGATDTPRFRGYPPRFSRPAGASEQERADEGKINRALQRLGRPEEIAYAVLFLASDESSFVTGHALVVDGGQTIDA